MATPEETLQAMLADFQTRNGTAHPDAARQLGETIDGDANLKRDVLKAIADGDLKRFDLQPAVAAPGTTPARGSFAVEERTIFLPAATLDGAVSTDARAVGELKTAVREQVRDATLSPDARLDRLLDAYQRRMESDTTVVAEVNAARTRGYDQARTPAADRHFLTDDAPTRRQLAADIRVNLDRAIDSSPKMKADLLKEVEDGRIASVQDMPTGREAAAAFGPFSKAFHVNAVSALAAQPKGSTNYYELVGAVGHEVDHSQGAVATRAALQAYQDGANAVVSSPGPTHDFTAVVSARLEQTRNSEARGQIDYLNSVVDAMPANRRTAQNLAENVPIDRRGDFFDMVPGSPRPTYSLKPSFNVDPPGSLHIPQTAHNVEEMAKSFFDRPQFGPSGTTSYRSMVAAEMVDELLKVEAANGNRAEVRIDLKNLRLDHREIQPLLTATSPPNSYYDLSDGTKVRLDNNSPAPVAPPPPVAPAVPAPGAPAPGAPAPPTSPAPPAPATPAAPVAPRADGLIPSTGSSSLIAPQPRAALMLDNPVHENHGMFVSALRAVSDRDAQIGRPTDEISRQLAGGLVEKARDRGLEAIGSARFTADGTKVGMTDTPDAAAPWAKTAVADVGQLAGQSLARSSENVAAINQQQTAEQSLKPPAQTQVAQGPEEPVSRGRA
ncbi:hypothetical protein ABIE09_002333 [Lysobacter enzymogenes]|uniref:XVIPCD domain-containing protein n=1 Tax=Lysobacter enzymogenes TaxID=69 RepID=UPI003395C9CD